MKLCEKEFDFKIGRPCIVIAEVGVNHNGNVEMAKKMVDSAVDAGADIVKFQSFKSEKEISRFAPKAPYQKKSTPSLENQLDMCKALELSENDLVLLKNYCIKKNIGFLCTAFESDSVDIIIDTLGLGTIKIPSGEITNIPLLEYIGERAEGVILSTGGSNMGEVSFAINAIEKGGCNDIVLLHCVTNYPAPYTDVNLKAIDSMRNAFFLPVGLSDHTIGISIPIAAATLGACAIEKHFTLDRNLPGPDHQASIEPDELANIVEAVRIVHSSLGDGKKRAMPSELPNLPLVRKSLVATRIIHPGEILTRDMVAVKRPETGISPGDLVKILGMRILKEITEDEPITWDHFKSI